MDKAKKKDRRRPRSGRRRGSREQESQGGPARLNLTLRLGSSKGEASLAQESFREGFVLWKEVENQCISISPLDVVSLNGDDQSSAAVKGLGSDGGGADQVGEQSDGRARES